MARVCMVGFTHYLADPRVRREAEALVERGDMVDVVCLRDEGPRRSVVAGVRLHGTWRSRYRGSSPIVYVVQYVGFLLAATATTAVLHLRRRYDVIQVHTMPDFMVFSALIPKLSGAKVLLDVHDLSPELYSSKFGLRASHWFIRFLTWVERRSVGFADRAIAVHHPHLAALVGHGNPSEKLTVILNAPDPKLFSPMSATVDADRRTFRVIYHGTVSPRHGLEVAVRAVSTIRDEIEGLELEIIGDGDGIPRLEELVRELGLSETVRIRQGFVPVHELAPLLADADLGVVPLFVDPFTRFMLPSKLLEYVTLGIPVVCSSTDTIRSYFDDSMVRFVEPGDVEGLARAMLDLYRRPHERRRLAANAKVFDDQFGWIAQRARYFEVIDSLINTRANGTSTPRRVSAREADRGAAP